MTKKSFDLLAGHRGIRVIVSAFVILIGIRELNWTERDSLVPGLLYLIGPRETWDTRIETPTTINTKLIKRRHGVLDLQDAP